MQNRTIKDTLDELNNSQLTVVGCMINKTYENICKNDIQIFGTTEFHILYNNEYMIDSVVFDEINMYIEKRLSEVKNFSSNMSVEDIYNTLSEYQIQVIDYIFGKTFVNINNRDDIFEVLNNAVELQNKKLREDKKINVK